jgi:hypothetical protein
MLLLYSHILEVLCHVVERPRLDLLLGVRIVLLLVCFLVNNVWKAVAATVLAARVVGALLMPVMCSSMMLRVSCITRLPMVASSGGTSPSSVKLILWGVVFSDILRIGGASTAPDYNRRESASDSRCMYVFSGQGARLPEWEVSEADTTAHHILKHV